MERQAAEARWGQIAAEALSGMSRWRTEHPRATLAEIETETDRRLAQLRARMIQDTAQASAAAEMDATAQRPVCPRCGCKMVKNGKRKRRLTTQHEQAVTLERQHMLCPQCGAGFFPPG